MTRIGLRRGFCFPPRLIRCSWGPARRRVTGLACGLITASCTARAGEGRGTDRRTATYPALGLRSCVHTGCTAAHTLRPAAPVRRRPGGTTCRCGAACHRRRRVQASGAPIVGAPAHDHSAVTPMLSTGLVAACARGRAPLLGARDTHNTSARAMWHVGACDGGE